MKKSLSHHLCTGIPQTSAAKSEDLTRNPCTQSISEVGCVTNIAIGPEKGFGGGFRPTRGSKQQPRHNGARNGDQERDIGDPGIVGPGYYPCCLKGEQL